MKKILLNTGKKIVKDVIEPLYIESSFVQVYAGVNKKLSMVNSLCAIHLLYWAIERMNKHNTLTLTKAEKKMFIHDMKNKYSISGVNKGLARLKDCGIISTTNEWLFNGDKEYKTRNSMYYINPYFFWKNPAKNSRIEMIKALEMVKKL